jgi:hypothetical protein
MARTVLARPARSAGGGEWRPQPRSRHPHGERADAGARAAAQRRAQRRQRHERAACRARHDGAAGDVAAVARQRRFRSQGACGGTRRSLDRRRGGDASRVRRAWLCRSPQSDGAVPDARRTRLPARSRRRRDRRRRATADGARRVARGPIRDSIPAFPCSSSAAGPTPIALLGARRHRRPRCVAWRWAPRLPHSSTSSSGSRYVARDGMRQANGVLGEPTGDVGGRARDIPTCT